MSARSIRRLLKSVFGAARRGESGALDYRSATEHAQIFLRDGRLVFVEQSSLGKTLGAYLVDRGYLTRAEYATLAQKLASAQPESPLVSLIEMCLEAGHLTPSVASSIAESQVERNFLRCMGWEAEHCHFEAGDHHLGERPRYPVSLEALALGGLRAHLPPEEHRAILAPYHNLFAVLATPAEELIQSFRLQPAEARVLRGIDSRTRLGAALAAGEEAPLLLAALLLSGHLQLTSALGTRPRPSSAVGEAPRAEPPSAQRLRLTLPQAPSAAEIDGAAAFQRGKRLLASAPEKARVELAKAASLSDRADYALYSAWAEYVLAPETETDARFATLEDATRRALEHDPTLAFGYYVVGHLYTRVGNHRSAALAFRRAARLDPTEPEAQRQYEAAIARMSADEP